MKPARSVDEAITRIAEEPHIRAIGVAVVEAQKLTWHKAYGEQSPGVPVTADTVFGLASITKTVSAEAILRQVAAKKISLDESMSQHWGRPRLGRGRAPHLAHSPDGLDPHDRPAQLAVRPPARQARVRAPPPGSGYSYSGEGIEYLAKFAEKKLSTSFAQLVESVLHEEW